MHASAQDTWTSGKENVTFKQQSYLLLISYLAYFFLENVVSVLELLEFHGIGYEYYGHLFYFIK